MLCANLSTAQGIYVHIISVTIIGIISWIDPVQLQPSGEESHALFGDVSYTCIACEDIENITWILNGTNIKKLNLANVKTEIVGSRTGILAIHDVIVTLNTSIIQCTATLVSGTVVHSEESTLIFQGI